MTRRQIAAHLRVAPSTVDRWRKDGMPFVRRASTVRFDRAAVDRWLSDASNR